MGLWKTIMLETFTVSNPPEQHGDDPNSLSNMLIRETFGLATPPTQDKPSASSTVTASLLKEAGFHNLLGELSIASSPEEERSATMEVIRQLTQKTVLEAVGLSTVAIVNDIAKGAMQTNEPEGPGTLSRLSKWGVGRAKSTIEGFRTRRTATSASRQKAADDDALKKQRADELNHQKNMNEARKAAAEAEEQYAAARTQTAHADVKSTAAALVARDSLQTFMDMLNAFRESGSGQNNNSNTGGPDVIDGEVKE